MSEVTDLTVIEIKPEQAPVLYVAGGLDAYLEQIRQAVNEVPDLSTKKGRGRSKMKETYTVKVEGVKVWVEVVNRKASYVATAMTGMRRLRSLPGQVG
ncbi:DUF4060 family protein [Escherichia coli]|nr:DUF4060 family protein [Escherichia coli]EFN5683043.1 DUF4060 family protein [Escherichia coli]